MLSPLGKKINKLKKQKTRKSYRSTNLKSFQMVHFSKPSTDFRYKNIVYWQNTAIDELSLATRCKLIAKYRALIFFKSWHIATDLSSALLHEVEWNWQKRLAEDCFLSLCWPCLQLQSTHRLQSRADKVPSQLTQATQMQLEGIQCRITAAWSQAWALLSGGATPHAR